MGKLIPNNGYRLGLLVSVNALASSTLAMT